MAADGSKNTRKGSEKLMAVLCKRQWMAVNSFLTALWTMEVKTQGRMQLDLKALVQRVPDELAVGPGPVAREDPGH